MLVIDKVCKYYRKPEGVITALENASVTVEAGEFVVVQGPSGCGKTTLLLTAGGLLAPDSGRVHIDDEEPYAMSGNNRTRLRGDKIGFVFQQFHLIPYLTVLENVLIPSVAVPRDGSLERAKELIERFGLSGRSGHVPAELSTGERQRAALARALLNRPRFLLADEPTGNLDLESAAVVLDDVSRCTEAGIGVLMVTHDDVAKSRADRILSMSKGKIVS